MATARQDTTTTLATDVDVDDDVDNNDNDDDNTRHQLYDERRWQQSPRAIIAIGITAKMPAHRWQRHLRVGNGNDTASCEATAHRGAEAARCEAEAARHEAEAARGREAAAARQVGHCKLRQPDGKEEVMAKSRGRGGGGATTEATRQPAGKQDANGRGGVQEANGRGGISRQVRGGGAPRGQEAAAARREASRQPAGGASGASSSSSLAIRREGGDQSVYLDSFVTEEAPEPENEKNERSTQYLPEM